MNNNKGFKAIVVTLLLAIAGLFGYQEVGTNFGGGQDVRMNLMSNLTTIATTTGSYCAACPVKLLSLDSDRRYAFIHNNSDTSVFLFSTTTDLDLTGTGATRYATGSITVLNGIELAADGTYKDFYELLPENMVYGHIWASSTAGSKEIDVNYY